MSYFTNNPEYCIRTNGEASAILSHFSDEYIIDLVEDNINNRFTYMNELPLPNIVSILENKYKTMASEYTEKFELDQIAAVRERNYRKIIDIICSKYKLEFNNESNMDLYSAAYYLYDFLVCSFKQNIIRFFVTYIDKEKNNIYISFNLAELKKNKDSSTIYGKKMYKNQKLAIINANLEYIINSICANYIPFDILLNNIYYDKNIVKYLSGIVRPYNDFFATEISPIFTVDTEYKFSILSSIKMSIHTMAMHSN